MRAATSTGETVTQSVDNSAQTQHCGYAITTLQVRNQTPVRPKSGRHQLGRCPKRPKTLASSDKVALTGTVSALTDPNRPVQQLLKWPLLATQIARPCDQYPRAQISIQPDKVRLNEEVKVQIQRIG